MWPGEGFEVFGLRYKASIGPPRDCRRPPIWLLHGSDDPVMPLDVARATEAWLSQAGATPRLQISEGLGHAVDERTINAIWTAVNSVQSA